MIGAGQGALFIVDGAGRDLHCFLSDNRALGIVYGLPFQAGAAVAGDEAVFVFQGTGCFDDQSPGAGVLDLSPVIFDFIGCQCQGRAVGGQGTAGVVDAGYLQAGSFRTKLLHAAASIADTLGGNSHFFGNDLALAAIGRRIILYGEAGVYG
nr:hypothetical protein SPACI_40950 [Sporomusa acidovorans DSM 3132]